MKLNKLVVGLFFFIWMALGLAVGLYVPFGKFYVGIPYYLIMQVINIGIAYELTVFVCASLVSKGDPPELERLSRFPRVALLYLSCNDAMPEALSCLNNQTYSNHKIFVLDDSTDEECRVLIDSYGFRTIRRGHRRGAKAGNLNHWLSLHGDQFEYFIVLDHDGIMKSTFVEEMLKYAEHPDNAQVAIFQSMTKAWNTTRLFPRLLDAINPLQMCLHLKVANQSDSMICWGRNMLCRVKPFQEIGGFDEDSATEDFATNLRLMEYGYTSKAVNVVSYDAASETVQFHAMRMTRWARGNLEVAVSKSWNLPLVTQLKMFMKVYSFSQWFFYVLGMLLVVWGYRVTWQQLYIALFFAFRWHRPGTVVYPLAITLFYTLYSILVRPVWVIRLTRMSWKEYWGYSLLSTSVGFYAVSDLAIGQIRSLLGVKARFIIGGKRWSRSSLWDVGRGMKWTVLLMLILAIGLARNPVARIFHSVWYVPLFLSPFIIHWAQNTPTKSDTTPSDTEF